MWKPFFAPSGRIRGSRKHDNPPGAWARTRNASDVGCEQNHLWPVSSYIPGWPAGSARVVLARTSDPPCFSVMAIPHSALVAGSGSVRRGSHSAASEGVCRIAGIDAYVIDSGQPTPASACESR